MKKEVAALKALSKGADGASAPPGVLRLYEAIEESKKELAFVAERVLCSLGNATHRDWRGVEAANVPRELLELELSEAEKARGAAALCEALAHARETRKVHL